MRDLNNRGSIFLLSLTVLSVLFILGISMTFFGGSEDWSSAMSYESEVAFNLAESAIEEFVARFKNSLNHNDANNELYKFLRADNVDISKEIPLQPQQIAALTAYTRSTARQLYGIEFGQQMVASKDFEVTAVLKLDHIDGVKASTGNQTLYEIHKDTKEKKGSLKVVATVYYRGHGARVSLEFLIRVVKTFVPPFNFFTLFVKDASVYGASHFNYSESYVEQKDLLRLDHGWNAIPFNVTNPSHWEDVLGKQGDHALTPPGRVYLGQDIDSMLQAGPAVYVRGTNGAKTLFPDNTSLDPNHSSSRFMQMNAQENIFLRFDIIPWMEMSDYVKNFMEMQGQRKTKEGLIFTGWKDAKIRLFNLGSGHELVFDTTQGGGTAGAPSFIRSFKTYETVNKDMIYQEGAPGTPEYIMRSRQLPHLSKSGFKVMGYAPTRSFAPADIADFSQISPTLVYGPALRQYFRAVQIHPDAGNPIELPYIGGTALQNSNLPLDVELTATQARDLVLSVLMSEINRGEVAPAVVSEISNNLYDNWDALPDGLKKLENYLNFMSDSGVEPYNIGLGNAIQRLKSEKSNYAGPLKDTLAGFLEGYPYPYDFLKPSTAFLDVVRNNPMKRYYEGPFWYALPDFVDSYLLDFYFIPRSTEDFFRGRMTVPIGGVSYDRFVFKYIDNALKYRAEVDNQTLELNGVLALNDSEPLTLKNLKFRGNGIIYSSPMMRGGGVLIQGDFLGIDTVPDGTFNSSIPKDMITIIAPEIAIDTSAAQAGDRCYVEANLISVTYPLRVVGNRPVTIKGSVTTPYLNLEEHFPTKGENVIIYNPLNGIWRNQMPQLLDGLYVAKIVTGGVGKFDWKYERNP